MGSISAMNSIDRVLENHGEEIVANLREQYPSELIKSFELENGVHKITIIATLADGSALTLEPIDIDQLAEDYPDCNVGY